MKRTLALMSSAHPSDDVRIALKEGRSLAEAGFDVSFIVPFQPGTASIHPVQPVFLPQPKSRSARMTTTAFMVFWRALRTKARVCHFHDPELLPYGVLLKLLGRKVIYDVHEDISSQILGKYWLPKATRKVVGSLTDVVESMSCLFFDAIVAATPAIAAKFHPRKTKLIQNFPLSSEINVIPPANQERRGGLIFVGGITEIRGVFTMLEVLTRLPSDQKLHLVGRCSPANLKARMEAHPGWPQVVWHGWLNRTESIRLLGEAQVSLLLFLDSPNHIEALPNKLFEYMAAGIPVVASDFPLWRSIIDKAGCGFLVNPHRPSEAAEKVQWLLDHPIEAREMGRRGRMAVQSKYNWDTEAQKLVALYNALLPLR
jgi:glycosyltransferase involved in cell wall biosynthesis